MLCVPYLYCDSVLGYKKRGCEISEVDLLKYKMQYEFFRNFDFKPCLENIDGFASYMDKSVFQIFCKKHHIELIVSIMLYLCVCIVYIICMNSVLNNIRGKL